MKKFTELSLEKYLQELSSAEPIPGGGSAAAYVASLAMGLTQMVGRISLKRKKKEGLSPEEDRKETQRRENIQQVIDDVEKIKSRAFETVNRDPVVYEEVTKAYGNPELLEAALWKSFQMQADLAGDISQAAKLNEQLLQLVSGSIKNDLLVSRALFRAAFDAASDTAHINVVYMKNSGNKQKAESRLKKLKQHFGNA